LKQFLKEGPSVKRTALFIDGYPGIPYNPGLNNWHRSKAAATYF
jgi:hypothetical protein